MLNKPKFLFIFSIFHYEHKFCKPQNIPNMPIERGSWKKSIKDIPENKEVFEIVLIDTRYIFEKEIMSTRMWHKEGNNLNQLGEDIIEATLGDGRNYLDVAFERIKELYEAENTIVITLGHGSALGINATDFVNLANLELNELNEKTCGKLKNSDQKNIEIETNTFKFKLDKALEKTYYFLHNKEFADLLNKHFKKNNGKKSVAILVMNNCFMQNVFSQYDFHSAVDYLVAPISGISFPGFNFQKIITSLTIDSTVDQMAKLFVDRDTVMSHRLLVKPLYKDYVNTNWFVQAYKLNSTYQESFKIIFAAIIEQLYQLVLNYIEVKNILIEAITRHLKPYSEKSQSEFDVIDFRVFIIYLIHRLTFAKNNNYSAFIMQLKDYNIFLKDQKFDFFLGDTFLNEGISYFDFDEQAATLFNSEGLQKVGLGFMLPIKTPLVETITDMRYRPTLTENTKFIQLINVLNT